MEVGQIKRLVLIGLVIFFSLSTTQSHASMGGSIDTSNDRIVPIFTNLFDSSAAFSGFLYSPRILFTAGHSPMNVGNYVGMPNSKADGTGPKVKVVKKYVAPEYDAGRATRDFAIYVLEKDLAPVTPFSLMTPEIEKQLIAANAKVRIHGYGIYGPGLGCAAGDRTACQDDLRYKSIEPRMVELTAHSSSEIRNLIGREFRTEIKDHFLMFSGSTSGPCPGDSGGSITATHNGINYYVGPTPNGDNVYACGHGRSDGTRGIHYSSQIYYHLNLLNEAEEFVKQAKATELTTPVVVIQPEPKKKSIICVKNGKTRKVSGIAPKCPTGFKKKK